MQETCNSECWIAHMSSAIPKILFSKGVIAPALDALLQSPPDSVPEASSSWEYLNLKVLN